MNVYRAECVMKLGSNTSEPEQVRAHWRTNWTKKNLNISKNKADIEKQARVKIVIFHRKTSKKGFFLFFGGGGQKKF